MSAASMVGAKRADSFHIGMAIAIIAVILYGFSFTVGENLFHPAYARPAVLYVHAASSFAWVLLFAVQAGLVRLRRVDLHRRLGQLGLVVGTFTPILGIATAIAMSRVRLAHGDFDAAISFPIPLNDATAFAASFALAAYWRRRSDVHKRLMLLATCILTAPGFGRIPALDHAEWFYLGVDALIVVAIIHDLVATRGIHPVYRFGFPAIVGAQLLTAYIRWTPEWLAAAPRIFS